MESLSNVATSFEGMAHPSAEARAMSMVPAQTLRNLYETKGYVSGDAVNNICAYVEVKHALQDYVARQRGPSESQNV